MQRTMEKTKNKHMTIVHHLNYWTELNSVGIITKHCHCGWESSGFIGLTSQRCPACGNEFKRKERKK
jgi:hypothetical protein